MTTKKPKRLHPVNIRLDDEMRDELRAIAAKEGRSLSNLMWVIVREWLDKRRDKQN